MTDLAWPPVMYRDTSQPHEFQPTLRDRTYHALRQVIDSNTKTIREIAHGANVELYWLRQFAQNRIPDPAVSRIERLYFYLTERRL